MRPSEIVLRQLIRSVMNESEKSRGQLAYAKARQLAAGSTYSKSRDIIPDDYAKDYPDGGPGSLVPSSLTAPQQEASQHLLQAWKEHADEDFFRNVTKVHWLGFTTRESRTASGALDDFLTRAAEHSGIDLSTIGYLGKINPGPRAGASFRDGVVGNQVQLGIEIEGNVTFATSQDAFTTNPPKKPRAHIVVNPNQSPYTTTQFKKTPRTSKLTRFQVGMISDKNNPRYDEDLHAEWKAAWAAAEERSKEDPENKPPGTYMDPSWHEVISAAPDVGVAIAPEMMFDKSSWQEPFMKGPFHNEVVVENWSPKAVYLNPDSATYAQIIDILGVAKNHGIPLLDLNKQPIDAADYERGEASEPKRRKVAIGPKEQPLNDPDWTQTEYVKDDQGQSVLSYKPVKYKLSETLLRHLIRSIL